MLSSDPRRRSASATINVPSVRGSSPLQITIFVSPGRAGTSLIPDFERIPNQCMQCNFGPEKLQTICNCIYRQGTIQSPCSRFRWAHVVRTGAGLKGLIWIAEPGDYQPVSCTPGSGSCLLPLPPMCRSLPTFPTSAPCKKRRAGPEPGYNAEKPASPTM